MGTQQLKLLVGGVRGLLRPTPPFLGHGEVLDLIAALPELCNWPEVMAFPESVVVAELDATSTGRLAFRLKKRYAVDISPQKLFLALSPPGTVIARGAPQIWPSGTSCCCSVPPASPNIPRCNSCGLVGADRACRSRRSHHGALPLETLDTIEGLRHAGIDPTTALLAVDRERLLESVYVRGYRRLVWHPGYTETELLLKYSEDELLICGTHRAGVMSVFMSTMRAGGGTHMGAVQLGRIVAIAAIVPVPSNDEIQLVADLYMATCAPIDNVVSFEEIEQFLNDNLVARWKDGLARLQDAGVVVPADEEGFPTESGNHAEMPILQSA